MDTLTLENQAWALHIRLNKLITAESKGFAVRYSIPQMKEKLYRVNKRANHRFFRRQSAHFNYKPGVFAPSPAFRSPGVVGQGAFK